MEGVPLETTASFMLAVILCELGCDNEKRKLMPEASPELKEETKSGTATIITAKNTETNIVHPLDNFLIRRLKWH